MRDWLRKARRNAAFTASGAALLLSALAFGLTYWERRSARRDSKVLPAGAAGAVTRRKEGEA